MPVNFRAIQIIKETIKSLDLNLNSYVVLTEVGSNNYIYTPIIPLLAGAKKVYAWTRDSSYGKSDDIIEKCLEVAKHLGLEDRLVFSANKKDFKHVSEADIITNSGFIRPINQSLLEYAKPNIAVPLMFEAWEIRDQDIDLEACTRNNVRVAGTWENHPEIKVFNYVKELTLKMLFEAGYEISGNKFIVWSKDHFGEKANEVLKLNNADEVIVTTDYSVLLANIKNVDAVLLFDYHETRDYFGSDCLFNLEELKQTNNHFGIVHLYGNVDVNYLNDNNISVYPNKEGRALNMTFTLAHVGLLPVLRLLTAGFKVGQESLQNNISNLSQPINF
jgi:hypothetical protein